MAEEAARAYPVTRCLVWSNEDSAAVGNWALEACRLRVISYQEATALLREPWRALERSGKGVVLLVRRLSAAELGQEGAGQ